jgi:hypothetical protein
MTRHSRPPWSTVLARLLYAVVILCLSCALGTVLPLTHPAVDDETLSPVSREAIALAAGENYHALHGGYESTLSTVLAAGFAGDMNGDGMVDIRDYGVWRQRFGATSCGDVADLNADCLVDIRDYAIWRQHFGETSPITGSVVLAGGASMVGGPAGQPLSIPAAFTATSPGGAVTEMRVRSTGLGCQPLDPVAALIAGSAWEPFVAQKTFSYTPPINFSTFTVAVQFRDLASNTSAVYCDSVSVEGNPVPPTHSAVAGTAVPLQQGVFGPFR